MKTLISDTPTRRGVLAGLGAVAALGLTGRPALALNTQEAAGLISSLVAQINAVINSGRSESQMIDEFERIFLRYADVPTIARTALGPAARSASAGELQAYTNAFTGYIARKYGKRFREFIGGEIAVKSARAVKSFYEVRSTVNLRNEAPFEVVFLVSDRSGRDLFFDMYIEGVSLLKSEAVEIRAMLDRNRGDVGALAADLRRAG
ncbi:MlaC/ttg2D family ABC transporter substrate-binding protein [Tranquillimonas alkanivorans]|nr:ABC transporter substrate-binding protein [Tranquillimonas alkanivorans]